MLLKLKIEVTITVVTVILIFSEYARNRLQNLALSDKWLCAVRKTQHKQRGAADLFMAAT